MQNPAASGKTYCRLSSRLLARHVIPLRTQGHLSDRLKPRLQFAFSGMDLSRLVNVMKSRAQVEVMSVQHSQSAPHTRQHGFYNRKKQTWMQYALQRVAIPDAGERFGLKKVVNRMQPLPSAAENCDSEVLAFPTDLKVIEATSYRTAALTRASRITIKLLDGDQKPYFLKVNDLALFRAAQKDRFRIMSVCDKEMRRAMMEAERRSMMDIYSYMPDFVPKPVN